MATCCREVAGPIKALAKLFPEPHARSAALNLDVDPSMISLIRKMFQSKLGIFLTLAFLAVIAFAFASADVSTLGGGGVASGDQVAVVGDDKISASDLSRAASAAVDNARQQNPTMSMQSFVEQDGLETVLDQLTERFAISAFAERFGLRAGTNLVNSEIISIPAFRGSDGNFDEETYRGALGQRGMSEAFFRDDLRAGLLARQLLVPASFGAKTPDKFAMRYASLLRESREGAIGIIPAAAFAPTNDPTDAQLKAFYEETRGDYIRPERRVIRYATFSPDALGERAEPTAQEIAAYYEENRSVYAPSETRTVTQLIVPTQQAAAAIQQRVRAGGSLEAAAREAGLQTAKIGPVTRADLSAQASAAVAQAVFAADRGGIAAPARSGLGFHVARVDQIDRKAGRNLEQARPEILTVLRADKRRRALADLAAEIEERIDDGAALSEVADDMSLELASTKPVTGAGIVYGSTAQERIPDMLAPALQTAFQMDESEPQLAEIVPGQTYLVFEVTDITESAAAPLAEIKQGVIGAWKLSEGTKKAKAAADRILKRVEGGATLAAAVQAEETALPRPDAVKLTRAQLAQMGGQVPAPLALFFSMAEGTTKRLEAPRDGGWFVVRLNDIEAGTIAADDPLFEQTKRELSIQAGREYGTQLRTAITKEMGVDKNDAAIEALRKQLSGDL